MVLITDTTLHFNRQLIHQNENFTPHTHTHIYTYGGVRISMSDFLTNFLRHFKVCPNQCTFNAFRVVSSIDKLNERLCLKLTKHDINYIYSSKKVKLWDFISKSGLGKWDLYLASRIPTKRQKEITWLSREIGIPTESVVPQPQVEQVGRIRDKARAWS